MPTNQPEQPEQRPKKSENVPGTPDQPRPSDQADDAIYRHLSPDAKHVLHALILLESVGVPASHSERVRAVAAALFDLPENHWDSACHELIAAGVMHKEHLEHKEHEAHLEQDHRLRRVASPELVQESIHDMLPNELELPDLWMRLEPVLASRHDAEALVTLGTSYNTFPWGNPAMNQQQAINCYRAALRTYTRATHSALWAMTQNNLGNAHAALAELTTGHEQVQNLHEAITAFEAALDVYTHATTPNEWATTQNNLGNALRQLALFTANDSPEEASRHIEDAAGHLRAALEVRTPQAALGPWAETQNNLANVLLSAADLHDGEERQRLLHDAIGVYQQVLSAITANNANTASDGKRRPDLQVPWAATQNNFGSALLQEATTLEGEPRRKRLDEAIAAYRAALDVYTLDSAPLDWAMAEYNLGIALHSQADMVPDEPNTCFDLTTQAIAAFTAALEVYTPESAPADCAWIYLRLALLQQVQATLQAQEAQEAQAQNQAQPQAATPSHDNRSLDNTQAARAALEEAKRNVEIAMALFHALGDESRSYAALSLYEQIESDLKSGDDGAQAKE